MNAQQFDIFDLMYDCYMFEKGKPIRLVELFSGIGFQRMGLELANIPYEVVGTSEIDRFAIQAYEAIHGDNHLLGNIMDIKGVDIPKDIGLMTYSFPCTDLSKAGTQGGMGKETNSGLVYEVIRILDELKEIDNLPKVLLMENVVDLIQAKFVKEFNSDIQKPLRDMGYTNYSFTMNAKDYGVAQNRDRVFMVSILGEYNYVEPTPFKLEKRLKDYLEDDVDESYYLSDKQVGQINSWNSQQNPIDEAKDKESDHVQCITAKSNTTMSASMVLLKEHLKIPEATIKGYKEAYDGDGVYIDRPHQKQGVVQKGMIQTLKTSGSDVGVVVSNKKKELTNRMVSNGHLKAYDVINHSYSSSREGDIERVESVDGISPTLTTRPDTLGLAEPQVVGSYDYGSSENFMKGKSRLEPDATISRAIITSPNVGIAEKQQSNLRIRKLTPKETGRLMGMDDKQIDKQLAVVSNSQAYKQHGNGIVAHMIAYIVGMMYYETQKELHEIIQSNTQ